ncbi:serine hydrolase domain-containing protein [Paenibacillus sp. JSM ZJ436]|uniref:serine hydrolase domain-containing protein n=1 Tax=Paenibacillus sp. JSM ZJ436 TaxID=3376190 RepID=UPI00378B3B82
MMDFKKLRHEIAEVDLRSCLISCRGELQFQYYRDADAEKEPAKINSCTKSILSALICIAMDQKILPGAGTPVSTFFPQLAASEDRDKAEMTLEHLLTMSSGISWTEFGGPKSFPRMTRSPDWIQFVLEQPLCEVPGSQFEYNSGNSQVLSGILMKASGLPTAVFAEEQLFRPLGIEQYTWEMDPQGVHTGGYGLKLTPKSLLHFGQLYLQKGCFDGTQLISERLLQQSIEPRMATEPPRSGHYAWHWWVDTFRDERSEGSGFGQGVELSYYYARGFGGQFVYVLPQLETVVVLTEDKRKKDRHKIDIFRQWIVPLLVQEMHIS